MRSGGLKHEEKHTGAQETLNARCSLCAHWCWWVGHHGSIQRKDLSRHTRPINHMDWSDFTFDQRGVRTSKVRMYATALGSSVMLLSLTSSVRRLLREPTDDGSSLRQFPGRQPTQSVIRSSRFVLSLQIYWAIYTLQVKRLQKL